MIKELGKNKARLIISVGSGEQRKRYTKTVEYSGKKQLKALHSEFEAEVRNANMPQNITLSELMSWYIEHEWTIGVKETTLMGYRTCMKRILRLMPDSNASSFNLFQIDRLISTMSQNLSPKTVKNTVSFLNSAYSYAVKCGVLNENPCKDAAIPRKNKKEIVVYNKDEIEIFNRAIKTETLDIQVALLLALYCGLRRSEIMGLEERHISIAFRTITVEQTRHRIDCKEIIQDTKSKSSRRIVAMPAFLAEKIEKLISIHRSQEFATSTFLIQDGFGQPMKPHLLGDRLRKVNERNNLPNVSPHGLRHTHATMLNAQGIDMIRISKQLGHSEPSITANVYTHLFEEASESTRAIADAFDEMIAENDTKNKKMAHTCHKLG